jgi:hypothetical protein
LLVKLLILNVPFSVVVAVSPPERPEFVPQAKPRTVDVAPPLTVILPLRVAAIWVIDDTASVVSVGFTAGRNAIVPAAQASEVDVVKLVQAAGSSAPEVHAFEAIPTVTAFPGSTEISA